MYVCIPINACRYYPVYTFPKVRILPGFKNIQTRPSYVKVCALRVVRIRNIVKQRLMVVFLSVQYYQIHTISM